MALQEIADRFPSENVLIVSHGEVHGQGFTMMLFDANHGADLLGGLHTNRHSCALPHDRL